MWKQVWNALIDVDSLRWIWQRILVFVSTGIMVSQVLIAVFRWDAGVFLAIIRVMDWIPNLLKASTSCCSFSSGQACLWFWQDDRGIQRVVHWLIYQRVVKSFVLRSWVVLILFVLRCGPVWSFSIELWIMVVHILGWTLVVLIGQQSFLVLVVFSHQHIVIGDKHWWLDFRLVLATLQLGGRLDALLHTGIHRSHLQINWRGNLILLSLAAQNPFALVFHQLWNVSFLFFIPLVWFLRQHRIVISSELRFIIVSLSRLVKFLWFFALTVLTKLIVSWNMPACCCFFLFRKKCLGCLLC